jgi:2-haloacid dehalogenase
MPPVYVFDVNETLLDLRALDAHFGRAFDDPGAREAWFQQLIQSALLTITTGRYHDFGTIAKAALRCRRPSWVTSWPSTCTTSNRYR